MLLAIKRARRLGAPFIFETENFLQPGATGWFSADISEQLLLAALALRSRSSRNVHARPGGALEIFLRGSQSKAKRMRRHVLQLRFAKPEFSYSVIVVTFSASRAQICLHFLQFRQGCVAFRLFRFRPIRFLFPRAGLWKTSPALLLVRIL